MGWLEGAARFFVMLKIPTNLQSKLDSTSLPIRAKCPTYFSSIPRMKTYSFFSNVLTMYNSSAVLNSKEPLAPGLPVRTMSS